MGSPDTYANASPGPDDWWGSTEGRRWRGGRTPAHTVNFVTAHAGFSLADLVSYNAKHNDANGEGNNDGAEGLNGPGSGLESRLHSSQPCQPCQPCLRATLTPSSPCPPILPNS